MSKTKPFGRRIIVAKERLDAGGLRLTPTQESDGQKNTGKIVAVGQVGILARFHGLKVGARITFKKFFVANDEMENQQVFVDLDSIIGIEND